MDLLSKIQLNRNSLTKNETKACDAIMSDMALVQHSSLADLSEKIGVTKTSILRFCQKLGYSGYSEFKYDLISYLDKQNNTTEINNSITTIESLYVNAVQLIHTCITENQIKLLAEDIRRSHRVIAAGLANSAASAVQLQYALLMYGIDITLALSATDIRIRDMSTKKSDLILVYSVSASSDIVESAFNLKEQNDCKIALITMNPTTSYKEKAEHFICLPSAGAVGRQRLEGIPIFNIFNEILLNFINEDRRTIQ